MNHIDMIYGILKGSNKFFVGMSQLEIMKLVNPWKPMTLVVMYLKKHSEAVLYAHVVHPRQLCEPGEKERGREKVKMDESCFT